MKLLYCLNVTLGLSLVLAVRAAPAKRLVIISVDGLRPVEYAGKDSSATHMPHLWRMARQGCASTGVTPQYPTVTFPNHTTMITGQPPAVHGITENAALDPFNITPGGLHYFAAEIRTPALWDIVKQRGGTTAAISWPVTVGARIDYLVPDYKDFRNYSELAMERVLSTPGLLDEIERETTAIVPGEMDDAWRAQAAAYVFKRYQPTLTLVHLVEADEAQHRYGPDRPGAIRALQHLDELIGAFREQVERRAEPGSVAWMIVSDHGFQEYDRMLNPLVALNNLGYVAYDRYGHLQSWRVLLVSSGGTATLVARDPEDREAIQRAIAYFEFLATDPQFGIRCLYHRQDLNRLGAPPRAFLGLDMAPGFVVGGAWEGRLVSVEGHPGGAHGYDPSNPNMRASFVVAGAGTRTCEMFRGGLLADVAPTAAALLGFDFPASAGSVRTEAIAP